MGRRKRKLAKIRLAGDPILTKICKPVDEYTNEHAAMICDMMYILTNSKTGVGLSANQAGYDKRIIIVKIANFDYLPMVNPSFKPATSIYQTAQEGCLSYPGKFVDVERCSAIFVDYYSPEDGQEVKDIYFEGLEARIIQHEIDHLDGKCIVNQTQPHFMPTGGKE